MSKNMAPVIWLRQKIQVGFFALVRRVYVEMVHKISWKCFWHQYSCPIFCNRKGAEMVQAESEAKSKAEVG